VILPWSHNIRSAVRLCARVQFQKISQLTEHRVRDQPNKRKMRYWWFFLKIMRPIELCSDHFIMIWLCVENFMHDNGLL